MQTSAQKVIQDLTNRVQAEKEELEQLERERDLWKYNAQMNDKEALRGNERKKNIMKKGGPLCYFCNKNHVPSLCRTYPDGISRQKSLENQGKCIKCLKIGHQNGDNFCEKHHIVCRTCQQSHVKAVCPILYPKKDTPPKYCGLADVL